MADTYCTKSCGVCAQREELNCPGCQAGPGSKWQGDCEIAKCCNEKGHECCETCSFGGSCSKLRRKDDMPEERRRKRALEEEKRERVAASAAYLGKWLWLLFWLVVPGVLADGLGQVPKLSIPANILQLICNITYGLILLKLAAESDRYRSAGICCFIAAGIAGLVIIFSGGQESAPWTLLITLPAGVVALVGEYHEYMGHAEILRDADIAMSEKWEKLWKWYIGSFGAVLGGLILVMIIPILGLLVMLAGLIGILVIGIMKLVYLYRTAKLFREYPNSVNAT